MSKYKPMRWFEIRLVGENHQEEVHKFNQRSKAIAYALRRAYRYPKCTLYFGIYLGSISSYRFLETLWNELD